MSDMGQRIAQIIQNDADGVIKRTMKVAQSDIMSLLSEYMDVTKLDMTVDKTDDGYSVYISAKATRIYSVGNTSDIE